MLYGNDQLDQKAARPLEDLVWHEAASENDRDVHCELVSTCYMLVCRWEGETPEIDDDRKRLKLSTNPKYL